MVFPDSIAHSLTDQTEQAARSEYYRAGKAIHDCMREQIRTGKLQLWGREASPIGPWRRVPAQASAHIIFVSGDVIKLPGDPGRVTLYDAVVAPAATAPLVASVVASGIVAAEDRCRRWLAELMRDNKAPSRPKIDFEREAVRQFGVGARAFVRAWNAAIVETGNFHWRRAGRKPSKS